MKPTKRPKVKLSHDTLILFSVPQIFFYSSQSTSNPQRIAPILCSYSLSSLLFFNDFLSKERDGMGDLTVIPLGLAKDPKIHHGCGEDKRQH